MMVGEVSSCWASGNIVVELIGTDGEISQWELWDIYVVCCFFKGSWLHDLSFNFQSAEMTKLMAFHRWWWSKWKGQAMPPDDSPRGLVEITRRVLMLVPTYWQPPWTSVSAALPKTYSTQLHNRVRRDSKWRNDWRSFYRDVTLSGLRQCKEEL